jgi:ATP-dependent RNA helicase DeaD
MFSATMPKQIIKISKKYMINPEVISVITTEETSKDVTQYYYNVKAQNKIEAVARLLHVYNPKRTLVFCNTKRKVDDVTRTLTKKGYNVDKIHGDLQQTQRLDVLNKFHNGVLDILVATDVAARGLDIKDVEIVFNYDVPEKAEFYVHRIGRTGRIGNKGYSFTLVSRREANLINQIENFTKSAIKRRNIPTPENVIRIKQEKQLEEIQNIIDTENTNMHDELSYTLLNNNEPHTVISALLSMIEKTDHSEQITGDINDHHQQSQKRTKIKSSDENLIRYHLNFGSHVGATKKDVANFIGKMTGLRNKQIKEITVRPRFSFFSTEPKYEKNVMSGLRKFEYKGKKGSVQIAKDK